MWCGDRHEPNDDEKHNNRRDLSPGKAALFLNKALKKVKCRLKECGLLLII